MKRKTPAQLQKPARSQKAASVGPSLAGGAKNEFYNIWYHKTPGRRESTKGVPAKSTCNVELDSGYTKAGDDAYICIYFAKGCCANGAACSYLHRAPCMQDADRIDMTKDIFGRDRHKDDREDMGGVGTFNRENKSLYVNGLVRPSAGWGKYESIARKFFGVCGPLQSVRVNGEKGFMFVKYTIRVAAEFAKEYMANQAMDDGEVLNVRWATEDPNPGAVQREEQSRIERLRQGVQKFQAQRPSLQAALAVRNQPPGAGYPPTANQYPGRQQQQQQAAAGGLGKGGVDPAGEWEIPEELLEPEGVLVQLVAPGDGRTFPKKGDRLTMHYTGTLASNGKKFDSSVDNGSPFQFKIGVGGVIRGWDEGVMQMSLGEKAILKITADYGYGKTGAGKAIPPNADLVFEVQLLAINGQAAADKAHTHGPGCGHDHPPEPQEPLAPVDPYAYPDTSVQYQHPSAMWRVDGAPARPAVVQPPPPSAPVAVAAPSSPEQEPVGSAATLGLDDDDDGLGLVADYDSDSD